jgi:polyisoprenoid-binding protein YceI
MARFRIRPEESSVLIEGSSSLHPITSRTKGLEGYVDLGDEPAGELSLAVSRLASGNPLEDREMRRRIDARRHPTIEGRLTSLRDTGDGRYAARGDVTFRGETRPHEGELTITPDGDTLRITGTSTFDVREFGMEPPRILMLRVHPEVTVTIDVVAEREG